MRSLFTCLFTFTLLSVIAQPIDSSFNMSLLGNWMVDTLPTRSGITYNDVWGYTDCNGREYAIIGSIQRVHFIDVTDPENPSEIASFEGGGGNVWRDFKVYRDRAYAVSDNADEGMMIFDLSALPDTIIKTNQTIEFFVDAHNIFIDELHGRLHVSGTDEQDYIIFDLTNDPDNPVLLGRGVLPGGGYHHDAYIRDNIGYLSQEFRGYFIWDFSDPTAPEFLASVPTGGYNHSSWVTEDGQYAIYAEEVPSGRPLGVVDLTNLDNNDISIVETFKFPLEAPVDSMNRPHNPFIRGKYLFVSYYQDGIQIFDIEDPENPKQIAFWDTFENTNYPSRLFDGTWGTYPFLPSGNILVSDIDRGLLIFSADSIDLAPVEVNLFPTAGISQSQDGNRFCDGDEITLTVADDAKSYTWVLNRDQLLSDSSALVVDIDGTYEVILANGHCVIKDSVSLTFESVAQPTITENGDTLTADATGLNYQWLLDGQAIAGATDSFYIFSMSGDYSLVVINDIGCEAISESISVVFVNTNELADQYGLVLAPNPVEKVLQVQLEKSLPTQATIWINDVQGRQLSAQKIIAAGQYNFSLDASGLTAGVYFLAVEMDGEVNRVQFVKR